MKFLPAIAPMSVPVQKKLWALNFCIALGVASWSVATLAADIRQEDLNSSLIYAAGQGDMSSFNLALSLGANINAIDRSGNNAVLMATQGEQQRVLRLLLDKGVDPNVSGGSGFTPLTYAAMHGSIGDLRLLLKAGANPNQHNVLGDSPLDLAIQFGHDDIMAELIANSARIDEINTAGEAPLMVAIRFDNRKAFDTLLTLGAETSISDKTGRSALFSAILEDHEAMGLALVEKGSRFDSMSDGYTPLKMAQIMHHSSIIAALTKRGAKE